MGLPEYVRYEASKARQLEEISRGDYTGYDPRTVKWFLDRKKRGEVLYLNRVSAIVDNLPAIRSKGENLESASSDEHE